MSKKDPQDKSKREQLHFIGYGFQLVSILLGAFFLGYFLDGIWESFPLFAVVFSVAAIVGMGYFIIKKLS